MYLVVAKRFMVQYQCALVVLHCINETVFTHPHVVRGALSPPLRQAAWRLVVYIWLVAFGLKKSYGEVWFIDPFLTW